MLDSLEVGWQAWLAAFVGVCAVILGSLLAHKLIFAALDRVTRTTDSQIDNSFVNHSKRSAKYILIILALFIVLPLLSAVAPFWETLQRILSVALTAAIGLLLVDLTAVILDVVSARYQLEAKDNLIAREVHTRARVLRRLLVAAIIIVTTCLVLMSIPSIRQIGVTLFASAGIAGLVAGIAARPALSNLIAGIQLALAQPIRIDDVVIIEGEWGWIEEITTTFVIVRVWDLRRLVVPLAYFIEKPFQNWTRVTADILGTVFVYVDYTVPVARVRDELHSILQQSELWDRKVWNLQVTNATEKVVELRALMSAVNSGAAWDLRCQVREKLIDFLQRDYPESLPRVRADVPMPFEGAAARERPIPESRTQEASENSAAAGA